MADSLIGTAGFALWCPQHGLVGLYADEAATNTAAAAHWSAGHVNQSGVKAAASTLLAIAATYAVPADIPG